MVQKRPSGKPSTKPSSSKPSTGGSAAAASSRGGGSHNNTPGGGHGSAPGGGRAVFVDLSKLRKTSLKRYKKHFNLSVKADSKQDLLAAVSAHFATMPVREADVALEFHSFARRALRVKAAAATAAGAAAGPATAAAAQGQRAGDPEAR